MFAVYAKEANATNPLASVVVGERPEPVVPEGWVRVRMVESRCGAVALGRTYLFPPLSPGGALVVRP